jgi:hypothetical protein
MIDILGSEARGLKAIQGLVRAPIVDHRDPLTSPITALVMLIKAAGFRWYGPEKRLPNGGRGTSCFLNTVTLLADGSRERKVVWSFIGGEPMEVAGDPVSIWQFCAALGFAPGGRMPKGEKPIGRAAAALLASVRAEVPWARELPFNLRGKALLTAAAQASHPGARVLIADAVDLYRGFCWKLTTPIDHPPHPDYGYALDAHYRFRKGKRTGDVRQSICKDERMEELRTLGLR